MSAEASQSLDQFVFDFWPTGSCDMECRFCYGAKVPDFLSSELALDSKKLKMYLPSPETKILVGNPMARPELNNAQALDVLTKMNRVGGSTVTVAGGEPLLREDTPEIIAFAKHDLKMTVYLSTDGTYVSKRYGQFSGNIDVMGLPLDGSSSEMNVLMGRRPYLFDNIISLLGRFKDLPPSHRVKIGTVVSRVNINDVEKVGEVLFRTPALRSPDVWRVYQFESIGRGEENAHEYQISNQEFEQVVGRLEERFPEVDLRPRSNETHFNAYFFVTPDGMLQVVNQTRHVSILDLKTASVDDLTKVIGSYKETASRANRNRDWLSAPKE